MLAHLQCLAHVFSPQGGGKRCEDKCQEIRDDGTDSGNSDRFPSRPWKREKKALATGEQEEHELPPSMDYDVEARFLAKYLSLDWATRQAIGHQVSKMLME